LAGAAKPRTVSLVKNLRFGAPLLEIDAKQR
jgi:hypothetical protein